MQEITFENRSNPAAKKAQEDAEDFLRHVREGLIENRLESLAVIHSLSIPMIFPSFMLFSLPRSVEVNRSRCQITEWRGFPFGNPFPNPSTVRIQRTTRLHIVDNRLRTVVTEAIGSL